MAQCFEIVAYTADGARYCPDCMDPADDDPEIGVVFGDSESEIIGDTCDTCGRCYADAGGNDGPAWIADAATVCRWARCTSCNGQYPYGRDDSDARLLARRNELQCPNCHGRLHFGSRTI
jgi:hypothetical protein